MPQNSLSPAEQLLHKLLDRHEEPRERSRDITQKINYTKIGSPAQQDDFHRVLQDAKRAGGIKLEKNQVGRYTDEFARVRLIDTSALYAFLMRAPSTTIADGARQTIEAAIPKIITEPFFRAILDEAVSAWKTNKGFLGLAATDINSVLTVLRLTHAITHLEGRDIDHRTFSRRSVQDSKALERSEGRVAKLLKRWNPSIASDEPREILAACGIVRRAHPLYVKGPIHISSDDMRLDGTGELFIGLPWISVQHATLRGPVDYIIIIENPTSFWRYCLEVEGTYLALLSNGFPARDVLAGMIHLTKTALSIRKVPLFHWGDIDAGGVLIAAHIEDALGISINLHDMSPKLSQDSESPLSSRKGLDRLSDRNGDIGQLARWLSSANSKSLEQEELDPREPDWRSLLEQA